ncbi:MAG: hypothetical protein KJ770_07475 [Actinobacteria bacterium]|nr:hypothetical protein [Actinomycetota bacterium]
MKWIKTAPIFIVVIVLLITVFLMGCSNLRKFADPIAENILVSMNEKNYESFSKDFDDSLKKDLTEMEVFSVDLYGTYEKNSKKFIKTENIKESILMKSILKFIKKPCICQYSIIIF